jgi:hypothetical protein
VLISDFWAAYLSVCAADRQYCLVHLLRELEKVDLRNDSAEWQAFAKKLRRLLRDGIRLRKRPEFAPGKFQSKVDRLNARLAKLAQVEHLPAIFVFFWAWKAAWRWFPCGSCVRGAM